tara:strand:- start:191 stop:2278 length:2088 start_codon:yes stop_codon:yes gene_type:complete
MASIKHLVDLDLNKNQLLNTVVQNLAVAPGSPADGQIYWDTADDTMYVWSADGSVWIDLGSDGITNLAYTAGVSNGVVTSDTGTDATIPLADGTNAGLFSAAQKTKLDGIETNAKDDQIASEVVSSASGNLVATNVQSALEELQGDIDGLESATNDLTITHNASDVDIAIEDGADIVLNAATTSLAGAMTGADKTKLDGIEANAKDDQTAAQVSYDNTTSALTATNVRDAIDELEQEIDALDAETNNLTITHNAGDVDIAIENGTDITLDAATTVLAGAMTAADKTKLDGVATGAEVNVDTNITVVEGASTVAINSSTGSNDSIQAATQSLAGVMTAADKTILDNLNSDQAAIYNNAGTPALHADITKAEVQTLLNFEDNADVTDTTNVTAAGAVMDSELTDEAAVKALNQGVATTDTPTFAGIITAGNVDGRDVSVDGTKLDGIEALADVTDATNVDAAGAVMNTDTTTAAMSFVVDEDDMVSDLATKVPTQQSVKAYVDAEIADAIASEMTYRGAYDASANPDSSAAKGDTFTVTVAGSGVSSYWSTALSVGDMIIAETANPSSEADWTEINKNIDDIVSASTTAKGIIELATQTEVNTGTDTTRAITPSRLRSTLGITATLSTTLTFSDTIGNGVLTSIPVTHSIGNQFVQASVYEGTSKVECEIQLTSTSVTTFVFNVAPTTNQFRVVITG